MADHDAPLRTERVITIMTALGTSKRWVYAFSLATTAWQNART
jgi:hypothetical protein